MNKAFYRHMSEADYNRIPGVRASYVKTLWQQTPAHLFAERVGESDRAETDAFRIGRALHCKVLRPDEFADEFAVSPKFDRRTKDGKAAAEAFAADSAGKTVVDEAESDDIERMADAVSGHDAAATLLEIARLRECVFTADLHGVSAKCRVDAMSDTGLLLDLKTTVSASPRAFAKSIGEFGYHLQLQFYREVLAAHGIEIRHAVIVAVEKARPNLVAVYQLDMAALDAMSGVVERCVKRWAECVESGVWPGYSSSVVQIEVPDWAIRPEAFA